MIHKIDHGQNYSFGMSEEYEEFIKFIYMYADLLPLNDTIHELLKEYKQQLRKAEDTKENHYWHEMHCERIEEIRRILYYDHNIDLYNYPSIDDFVIDCAWIMEIIGLSRNYGWDYPFMRAWCKEKLDLSNKKIQSCLMFLLTHECIDCVEGRFRRVYDRKPFNEYLDLIYVLIKKDKQENDGEE